eukprot:TRINITY_DN47802_c0_g1_i1.p1 TRINITY_DN47802_c0_g1~~TRINITY_DN47802_c0_g1_i1.p1  ORF type:complete len:1007 (+),score=355.86 TRINITY_DN47802_c0_g1_i1:41-3061(+)
MEAAAGRVQVFARVRPPVEQEAGFSTGVELCEAAKSVRVRNDGETMERILSGQGADASAAPEPKEYVFDGVFPADSAQRDVFMQVGLPVLREALRGVNGTILAYGQTGSGKTHSLLHQSQKSDEAGLLPRLVASLFLMVSQDYANVYEIEAASVQVYNEQVDDLLHPEHQSGTGHNLNVRDGGIVPGLTWIKCTKPDDMLDAFTRARANVVYAETKMNKASSRSHAVFQLRISKRQRASEAASGTSQRVQCTIARLNVVDLAGSERVKKSGVEGMQFKEATNINRSLLAFGNVVSALAARKAHVPLRDSKLTRILDGSIGGNCRTALLVCASPAVEHAPETLNTFEFASRAMRVEVDAKVNTALVEVSAKALLADLDPDAHNFGKVQADKKELEALRRKSSEAAEQAKREAQKREEAAKEARGRMSELEKVAEDAEKRGRHWQEQLESLRREQELVQSEVEKLRRASEVAAAEVQQAKAALQAKTKEAEAQAKEAEKLRAAVEKAEEDALEWRAAAELRAQEVKEVRVVQAKKDTADILKKKEEVVQAKKTAEEATKKLQEAKQELSKASSRIDAAEARASTAEKVAAAERDRAAAAEKKLQVAHAEARQEAAAAVEVKVQEELATAARSSEEERQQAQDALRAALAEAEDLRANLKEQSRKTDELRESLAQQNLEAEQHRALLEADLVARTQELKQRDALLDEAHAQLKSFQQEAAESEERLRQELQRQFDALREEHGKEADRVQQLIAEEKQRHKSEKANIEAMLIQKASDMEAETAELTAQHAAAVDAQRQDFEARLSAARTELEARLAEMERGAEEERKKLLGQLDDARQDLRQTEERWKEMKEMAVREAWENGNAQQRRLAAAFKAARNINEVKEAELKEAHDNLAKRFAARESREEDVKKISDQQRRLQEQQRFLQSRERDLKDTLLELQNRDECDRIFGSAEKRRPRSASRQGLGQHVVGKKLGEAQQFAEREKRRMQSCGARANASSVLLGNTALSVG